MGEKRVWNFAIDIIIISKINNNNDDDDDNNEDVSEKEKKTTQKWINQKENIFDNQRFQTLF